MKRIKQSIKDKLGKKKTASLKKALKVGRIIKNIICWTLIAVLTAAIVIFMTTKISGGTPTVFGYSIHRIVSGSMEPTLEIGDVILSTEVKDTSDVHVGDIVTFQGDSRFDNQKVTHRVLVSSYDDGKGNIVIVTKGDANAIDDGEINFSDVESKFVAKVSFLSDIYNFFFSPWGLIIFIFLLLLIFFDEILNIIRLSVNASDLEDTESFEEIVERVKCEQLAEERKKRLSAEMSKISDISESEPEKQEEPEPTAESEEELTEESETAQTAVDESDETAQCEEPDNADEE